MNSVSTSICGGRPGVAGLSLGGVHHDFGAAPNPRTHPRAVATLSADVGFLIVFRKFSLLPSALLLLEFFFTIEIDI